MSLIASLYRRFAELIHELAKFGAIGVIAAVLDLGGAAVLHGAAGFGPLGAKTISTFVAATFAYAGNRIWTFRHRARVGLAREYLLFFALNGVGLLIALLVIGFTEHSLGMRGQLAFNVAQVTGTAIGTIFRYLAYKEWVFLPPEMPAVDLRSGLPTPPRGGLHGSTGTWLRAPEELDPAVHEPQPSERSGVFTRVR